MSLVEDVVALLEEQQDQDLEKMLAVVLARLRRTTASEAGTIFISRPVAEHNYQHLEALVTQNDKVDIDVERFNVAIDLASIAGYVASTGEVVEIADLYDIPVEKPYSFNPVFDQRNGYHSTSMLAFPLKNIQGNIIGVVQLINHITGADEEGHVHYGPFTIDVVEEMRAVQTMLGALVERFDLVAEIQKLRQKLAQQEM